MSVYLQRFLGRPYQDMNEFMLRIKWMNKTFEIGRSDKLVNLGYRRVRQLHTILSEELTEIFWPLAEE